MNISTTHGVVTGRIENAVSRYLGIPYAAPLSAANRLRPPRPVASWSGARNALEFGPTVPQNGYAPPYSGFFVEPDIPGEESLNLNVWAPESARGAPVLVWIHGGAFAHGSGAVPQYDGTAFAKSGIVCVTINYRLGVEGFLDLGDGDVANVGLLDQLAALRWVRDNIAAFGGDPARVTVAGESAGAMSIGCLLASPLAVGLFQAAILQSGAAHHAIGQDTARAVAAHVCDELGIELTREAVATVPTARLLEVLGAVEQQVQTQPDFTRWGEVAATLMPFMPTIDGTVVPQRPLAAIAGGSAAGIPLLIGTNTHENRLFMAPTGVVDLIDEATLTGVVAAYGFTDAGAIAELYLDPTDPSPGATLAALSTDWMFRIPAIRLAEAQGAIGAPTWMYEFAWESPVQRLRACHALELPFVFNSLDRDGSDLMTGPDAPQALAGRTHAAWARFITNHDPGWDRYTSEHRAVHTFDLDDHTALDPARDQRKSWDGLR
ncbi:carboxylesterase/lipase family protein [Gordonia sp. TBRC 11910]|uniref:Carboxylic ester hydrolase n=1 Tax=Gordonia asplenii TaxID=2725283 RepID=A0A848KPW4_9ACTN|nr:carboxylesterase family protein [Gordonia asplenii]NMN99986.1 carboxylesterase/lipase family protein [Gordonia asplenii]